MYSDAIYMLHVCMYVCVSVCTPTKGWFTPSLQADSFAVRLNKEVFHTHVLCDNYVLGGRGWGRRAMNISTGCTGVITRVCVRGGACTGVGEGHPLTDLWAT